MATNEEFVQEVVGNAVENATVSDTSAPPPGTFTNVLEAAPGLPTSLAFTAQRGANTILGGGWGSSQASEATQGAFRNNNPFRTRTWNRYGSQSIFFENNRGPTGARTDTPGGGFGRKGNTTAYSPFQFATNAVNKASEKAGRGKMIDRGSLSRFTASSRLGYMSDEAFDAASGHSRSFLRGTTNLSNKSANRIIAGGPQATRHAMLRSMDGKITGRMGGFISQATGGIDDMGQGVRRAIGGTTSQHAKTGVALARKWGHETAGQSIKGIRSAATTALREGADDAGRVALKTAGGKQIAQHVGKKAALGAAKFAASRTAAYAIPYAGQALLLYDIAKMGTALVGGAIKGTVRTAAEGFKSFQGGINTGPMEQGFKDNEVTMTSRQRGVMAIQNSRLNARSALGSEAAGMYAHFG